MASAQRLQPAKARAGSNGNDQTQKETKACIKNVTQQKMMLLGSKSWNGNVVGIYPPAINPNRSATFTHLPDLQNGSTGAVVYTCKINETTECAWLVAWSAPVGSPTVAPQNQVYVDTAKKDKYTSIDWDKIKKQLDVYGSRGYYKDYTGTGCTIAAEINHGDEIAILETTLSDRDI